MGLNRDNITDQGSVVVRTSYVRERILQHLTRLTGARPSVTVYNIVELTSLLLIKSRPRLLNVRDFKNNKHSCQFCYLK